jgi:imidazoleglycerol-phosphate dehydratase
MAMSEERPEERRTSAETDIMVTLGIEGSGKGDVATGIPFFDHMLLNFAKHGLFDLTVKAEGDLAVGAHHTVEDVGICLGDVLKKTVSVRDRFVRYGTAVVPHDEALVMVAVDISGRGYLAFDLTLTKLKIDGFETESVEEFFRALAYRAGMTVHVRQLAGHNTHHLIEAAFKAFGRALNAALTKDERIQGVQSTKGVI